MERQGRRGRIGPERRVEVDLGNPAHGGFVVARLEGRVMFVRHGLPGERVCRVDHRGPRRLVLSRRRGDRDPGGLRASRRSAVPGVRAGRCGMLRHVACYRARAAAICKPRWCASSCGDWPVSSATSPSRRSRAGAERRLVAEPCPARGRRRGQPGYRAVPQQRRRSRACMPTDRCRRLPGVVGPACGVPARNCRSCWMRTATGTSSRSRLP